MIFPEDFFEQEYYNKKCSIKLDQEEMRELKSSKYLFIFGGDGTYLRALGQFKRNLIPEKVFAFNCGHFGALLPLNINDLRMYLKNNSKYEKRYRLCFRDVMFSNELVFRSETLKLNEFTVKFKNVENVENFENDNFDNVENVKVKNFENFEKFTVKGDALLISTPSGSTGYNHSGNGPEIRTKAMVLNVIAPNRNNFRPIVLNLETEVIVEAKGVKVYADMKKVKTEDNIYRIKGFDEYKVILPKK